MLDLKERLFAILSIYEGSAEEFAIDIMADLFILLREMNYPDDDIYSTMEMAWSHFEHRVGA